MMVRRLHAQVTVQSNALDLMAGKFGGMTVQGKRWLTPLKLTAESIQARVRLESFYVARLHTLAFQCTLLLWLA
jgi:hypothetical protein